VTVPWDSTFEQILRAQLPGAEPAADTPLTHYGLDSMGMLRLGRTLGQRYGIDLRSFDERAFRSVEALWAFVDRHASHPPVELVRPLIDWFARSAVAHPDAACVIEGDRTTTYAEMAAQASALAATIGDGGVVAVLGEREAATYRAYLAALYAGAAVVPLSLDFPPARNAEIARQAGVRCVVHTDERANPVVAAQLAAMGELRTVDARATPEPGPHRAAVPEVPADQVAYFIFTSGSTGGPKGVGITHGNIHAFLTQAMPAFAVGPGDIFSQCHGLTFDFSVFEMWGAWSTGAALLPVSRLQALDPADTANRYGVTVWACTPSLLDSAASAGHLAPGSLPRLRHLVIGGEPLPRGTVEAARAAAPLAIVDNVYGPTEATIWATTHRMAPGDAVPDGRILPIGTPAPTVRVRLGADGELLLGGPQVFHGYLDAALTAAKFTHEDGADWYRTGDLAEWDEAGLLHHLGRIDGQVKVRGYRVELGEIEKVAAGVLGGARVAAVRSGDAGRAELVLFVEASAVDESAVRRELAKTLPYYMVPRRVFAVASFQLTAHAKLDRNHLVSLLDDAAAVSA
jgi:amino acid adenylation domain-containing protein